MDRLISQFEVIRAIEKFADNIFTKNMGDLINDIKAIPTVQDDDYVMIKRTTWEKIEKALDSVSARGC